MEFLIKNKVEFYTYALANEKANKWVIKGLPPEITADEIIEQLSKFNIHVLKCVQLKQKKINSFPYLCPIYMISVSKSINFNQVNNIKSINHVRISWEKYKNNKSVLQCLNCQKFGHSIANCFKKPKYVKCLGNHRTTECNKEDDASPQCVNCGGPHPANFAGCSKFQDAIHKMSKKKPASKLTKVTKMTNHPGQNANPFEPNNDNFPPLIKTSSKVFNPSSTNPIMTYSQITNQIFKPSQTSINNLYI